MTKYLLIIILTTGLFSQDIIYHHKGPGVDLSNELYICLHDSFTLLERGSNNDFVFNLRTLEIPGVDSLTIYDIDIGYINMFNELMVVSSTFGYCPVGFERQASEGLSKWTDERIKFYFDKHLKFRK